MSDLEESFEKLLERQPTDGERQRLYRARDALNIKPTDAVWTLLMIMEHYQTMYEEVPRQIAEAARNATETIRVTAEVQAKAAQEETKKGLMKAVTEAPRDGEATRPGGALQVGERRREHRVHHGLGGRVGRESAGPRPRFGRR